MQEKLENNREIWNNGTLRAGNKNKSYVGGGWEIQQKIYLEWPTNTGPHTSAAFSHIIHQHKQLVVIG